MRENLPPTPPAFALFSGQKKPPLGSNANISAIQQNQGLQPFLIDSVTDGKSLAGSVDLSTGEMVFSSPQYDPVTARLERFALQSAARRLLPDSRTAKCLRLRQGEGSASRVKNVEVWKSSKHQTAHYVGLQTCASPWSCPVCAAKISERRRVELLHAMLKHEANGGQVLLLTLTTPHTRTDNLPAMLKAQAGAMSRLNSLRNAKALWHSIGCIGTVRAWEVTYGNNGWHPHFHLLLFVSSGLDLDELQSSFYDVWANCCRLAKLPIPSLLHGVRLDDGTKAANYVSKGLWGLDSEMTKGHIKKASNGGRSPFDLLRSYLYDRDKQAGALFIEYAKAFNRKHQLEWSKGLKALFVVEDMTDEETAAKIEDDAYFLGMIEPEDWVLIRRANVRGEFLEIARHGWDAAERFLCDLRKEFKVSPDFHQIE
jgi:hypothetical protein